MRRSTIIDYLLHLGVSSGQKPNGVVFLYCRYDEKQSIQTLLDSLAIQLVQDHHRIPKLLQVVFNLYDLRRSEGKNASKAVIIQLLLTMFSFFNKVYIILDALDEVPDRDQVGLIADLILLGGSLLLASRRMNIFNLPKDTLHVSIGHNNQANIRSFLHQKAKRITGIVRLVLDGEVSIDEVRERIQSMSKGMYVITSYSSSPST